MAVTGMMLIGQEKLMARLQVLDKEMTQKTAEALRKAGGEIIRVAIPKTPRKTGELRSRSFNEGPLQEGSRHIQVIGYEKFAGDWDQDNAYAVAVHENLEARHDIGEAKYLEHAIEETEPYLLKYLAKEMKL
jgi:hypothetical protein